MRTTRSRGRFLLFAFLLPFLLAMGARGAEKTPAPQEPTPLQMEQTLKKLRSDQWIVQAEALSQLARWKATDAVGPIRKILEGKQHPWTRGRALVALSGIRGGKALKDALLYSGHEAPELRAAALEALAVIGSPKGEAVVLNGLKDRAPAVRYQAVVALARLRREKAWDAVRPLLADADPVMVAHAARALAHVNTADARAKLIELLAHKVVGVRLAVAEALRVVRPAETIPPLLNHMVKDEDAGVRTACEKTLATFEPGPLTQALITVLRSEEQPLYPAALTLLAWHPTTDVRDQVAALARQPADRHKPVLRTMLKLVAHRDPSRYEALFVGHLAKTTPQAARLVAIEKLVLCKKADHFKAFRDVLADPDEKVRNAAFDALDRATRGAPPEGIAAYLSHVLSGSDARARGRALRMLSDRLTEKDLPQAVELLAPLLGGKDRTVGSQVAGALNAVSDNKTRRPIILARGYVTDWMIIGPFPNDHALRGLATPYPPERGVDDAATYTSDQPFFGYGAEFKVIDAQCAGVKKRAFSIRPPWDPNSRIRNGSAVVTFPLTLPRRRNLKLSLSVGLHDARQKGDGVRFEVRAGGKRLFETAVEPKVVGWRAAGVDLSPYAGKKVALELVIDGLKQGQHDWAVVGEPRVLAGEEPVVDLLELAGLAAAVVDVGAEEKKLSWQPARVTQIDGVMYLQQLFKKPDYAIAYAAADIEAPEQKQAHVWVRVDEGCRLWVNGGEVKLVGNQQQGAKGNVMLRKGRNQLLLKTANRTSHWFMSVWITDLDGKRIDALRVVEMKAEESAE